MWTPRAGVTCNECTPSLRHGRASRPLLVTLLGGFGPFTVKLPPHGCFDRMCFRPRRHLLLFPLIHMDICVWDVAHFHGCRFATALLYRVRMCVCTCACSSYSQHTLIEFGPPHVAACAILRPWLTRVIVAYETSGYCVYSLCRRYKWNQAHR
jgi:hypothetical protein